MAAADTARLVAQLLLDAKGFTKGLSKADKDLGKLESTAFRVGQNIGSGTKAAIGNIAKVGVVAAGAITVAVGQGLRDLATLESAVTSVDGAIEQMGLTGQITGAQVADWANDIERDIDAAFDDKDITAAAATLLRFGKVTPKNLKPALEVVADLAVKTGDVESASELLAKALADPAKAAGKLAKNGIILTKAQQDTIKAMLEQNDVAGAQNLILEEVAKTTEGAAAASQGRYADALNILNDAAEDARKALAIGFLPVIEKVADKLSTALANPAFVRGLEEFGVTLAGGLDDLISVAEQLPWATIGTSLQIAGAGAKTLLEAFVSLPPWVQTAVITGWGLNKLTGGALGGIVGELGKGLIKGVLGIQAAQVNIQAANVTGLGGLPGGTGPAGGRLGGLVNAATKVFIVGAGVGVLAEAFGASGLFDPANVNPNTGTITRGASDINDPSKRLEHLLSAQKVLLERANGGDTVAVRQLKQINEEILTLQGKAAEQTGALNEAQVKNQQAAFAIRDATAAGAAKNQQAAFAVRDAVNTRVGFLSSITQGVRTAVGATTAAARAAGQQAAFAIRDKDLSVSVATTNIVNNTISVRETIRTQTTHKQYQRFVS